MKISKFSSSRPRGLGPCFYTTNLGAAHLIAFFGGWASECNGELPASPHQSPLRNEESSRLCQRTRLVRVWLRTLVARLVSMYPVNLMSLISLPNNISSAAALRLLDTPELQV